MGAEGRQAGKMVASRTRGSVKVVVQGHSSLDCSLAAGRLAGVGLEA